LGRAGRGGGGFRGGGGGRMGGSLGGGSRVGGGRMGGSLGGAPRAGRGTGGIGRAPAAPRTAAPRPAARPVGRSPGFGAGMATGMMLGGGRRRRMGFGWGWGGRRRVVHHHHHGGGPAMGGGGGGCGCFSIILAVLVVIMIISAISFFANLALPGTGGLIRMEVPQSTVQRTALPSNAAMSTGTMFIDNLDWIHNSTRLNNGLNSFHSNTGVRPFLYLTDNINGNRTPTTPIMRDFTQQMYQQFVTDGTINEAHVLVVVFNYGTGYGHYIVAGNQASAVIDQEAVDIISGYIMRYWYTDMEADELFARAFDGAGTRMMTVTRSPWINVMIVFGVLLILFLLYTWWKGKQEQKNIEAEQTERILNQSLDTFSGGYDEASQLAQQYSDTDGGSNND